MLEAACVAVAKKEGHECCTIVNGVAVLSLEVVEHVVLDNGALVHRSFLRTGGLKANSVTKGKDIFVLLVLKSVFVNINATPGVRESSVSKEFVGLGWGIDAGDVERLLNDFLCVDILEHGNLLFVFIFLYLEHFPAEHDIDAALVALVKRNFVSISELVDFLVGGPELDSRVGSRTAKHFVLSHEVLIVKGVEVSSLAFVWELGGVADHVSVCVVPAVPEVAVNASLVVEHVNEYIIHFVTLFHILKTLDVLRGVVKSRGEDESLVGELLVVAEVDLVVLGVNLGDRLMGLNL